MNNFMLKGAAGCLLLAVAGCGGTSVLDSHPLFFAQGITLGVSGGTAPQNGNTPEFTLGYKQLNVALVPTVVPGVVTTTPDGQPAALDGNLLKEAKILGSDFDGGQRDGPQDALSTFGSFEADTSTNAVNLGVFFATGVAAQKLASGFQESVVAEAKAAGGADGDSDGDADGDGDAAGS